MDNQPRHSIADLARLTGVTPRTVRYYIAQGLLPGANDAGQGAWYDERHLARLRLIRRLQAQHLPLAEIRTRLDELTDDDVGELLAAEPAQATPPQTSALEYVRGVLGTARRDDPWFTIPQPPTRPLEPSRAPLAKGLLPRFAGPVRLMRADGSRAGDDVVIGAAQVSEPPAMFVLPVATPPAATPAAPTPPATSTSRSQWDRIGLTPDIELHVRRPLSRLDNRRVERLITIARQLLKEDQP